MWGEVTVGGIGFRETRSANQGDGSLKIVGQESHPPSTRAYVVASHHNILGLADLVVPVIFTDKEHLTGFYRVTDSDSVLTNVHQGAFQTVDWQLTMDRLGSSRDVEFESVVPRIARPDDIAGTQTAVFWHAPPAGATSYLTGPEVPASFADRVSADGAVRVHLGIPAVSPRWTVAAGDYMKASVRFLVDGIRRAGLDVPEGAVWELNNGLVRVTSGANGRIVVSCWSAGAWRSTTTYAVKAGATLAVSAEVTVLRNDTEEIIVRLTYPRTTAGRTTVDLGLRRGSRFVTGRIKNHSSVLMAVDVEGAAGTVQTGGVLGPVDADGNRYAFGAARSNAPTTVAITRTSTALDFFAGHQVGSVPEAGDAFADLLAQYLGSGGERVRVVRR